MGREGGVLELGSCLVMGRYMELAVSGNHSFSYSNSSLLSFMLKAERSVDSGTKVLPRLLFRSLCSTQIQGSKIPMQYGNAKYTSTEQLHKNRTKCKYFQESQVAVSLFDYQSFPT